MELTLDKPVRLPACSEMELMVKTPGDVAGKTWILETSNSKKSPVAVARAIVCPAGEKVPVRLLNPRDEVVTVTNGTPIAVMEEIEEPIAGANAVGEAPSTTAEVPSEQQKTLWDMVVAAGSSLNSIQQEQLFFLLLEFADVFAFNPNDLGRAGAVTHKINTGDSPPIRQRVRRIPQYRREEAKQLLQGMLKRDVVQPSDSPWASPIVLVRKKNGAIRFCIDYRKVNAVTRKDAYPLPRIDDTLDTLSGSKLFSTLDLASGYWQVEVEPQDREKTAFCTPEGLYEFKVMPFGLCNAPATFQRLMDRVLSGLQWRDCLVYRDDVIVVGKTFEDHLQHLKDVFHRLRLAGLKLQPPKCAFCKERVEFLGHIVSATGVAVDPDKTEKVAQWPIPVDRREVQQFLGLANYYRRFVRDFATIARPLHRLTEKTAPFEWTNLCQGAFEELRRRLTSAPVLAYPNSVDPFILDTDASDTGIGAILSQSQPDGTERVIAYASRALTRQERRYCVTRRELLAAVEFTHHFRCYLIGRKFTLRTDHASLTWLQNFREPEGQLARWLERLQEYDFELVHRPGRQHSNADAMSRMPCTQCGRDTHDQEGLLITAVTNGDKGVLLERSPEELRHLQLSDPTVGLVLHAMEVGEKPDPRAAQSHGPETRRLLQLWNRLEVKDGTLWRRYEDIPRKLNVLQLVVPASLREEVLQELHAGVTGGHLGEEKTLSRLRERLYWPGCAQSVSDWCRTCATCATRKSSAPKRKAPLETVAAGYPMQVVAVDILGPLPETEQGNRYVLVAGDYFTKWVESYAIPDQEATTVAQKLTDEMFCRFSPPEQLHSDQGKQFESKLVEEICKLLQVKKTRTTPYHPQCDGMVERFNRTLLDMLATTLKDHPFDWEYHLSKVCFAYNTSVHSSNGFSPFFLMFGRQAQLPLDLMYGTGQREEVPTTEYARKLKQSLEEAYALVRTRLSAQHERRKAIYDQKIHGDPYTQGDLVWLHSPAVSRGLSRKLHHVWKGPFRVLERVSNSDYRIKSLSGKKRVQIVHFDRLKPCTPGTRFNDTITDQSQSHEHESDTSPVGSQLEIIDTGEDEQRPPVPPVPPVRPVPLVPPRYPARNRQPPNRYGDYFSH